MRDHYFLLMRIIIYAVGTVLKDFLSVFNLIYSTKIKRKGEGAPGLSGYLALSEALFCGLMISYANQHAAVTLSTFYVVSLSN